ncbi:MAG: hypothetical protein ABIJ20_02410 [Nanoarchaeota archaeon]|nr:hypothetical protein [Nanoarchaeota archaeon]MBU1444807.1 hypothetical protein [Nanoarchaeota archaeon]MBU2406568.1 hypothetical protein [Nanoarchaeota archaeon]MBU2420804.1 hypothetical protein [Nanoarchaeota archaeon]MBU2475619.1 hypothetical protein [Nanoarchaeota archaeon]
MRNRTLTRLVVALCAAAFVPIGCASMSELPYVEPVQIVSDQNWDYDLPLEFTEKLPLQKADKSN